MAIELRLQVRLSQQLVMTPQLQQAIKLLQLNRLELVTLVEQELQENPILEEMEGPEEPTPVEVSDTTPGEEREPSSAPEVEASAEAPGDVDPSDAEKVADVEWENYMEAYPQTGMDSRPGEDEDRRSLEATLTRRPTLAEHLRWQIQLSDFTEAESAAAYWIVGNIDDDGFLRSTDEELARQSGLPEEVVAAALEKVQLLDPTGVAARDLRECLLLQITSARIDDPIVIRIVDEYLDLLRRRDFRGLTRALGVTIEEVSVAIDVVSHLEPRPGRAFGGDDPIYITPDIYVYKVGDEYHILLNEDGLPKLRINNLYREVLTRKGGGDAAKDTREYVSDKLRSAMWLIKSIHQRQRTIYKVMQSIIRHQTEFFERGISFLKPLNLRDVADDIEMHESTVSRVTTNKYVHTPQGIFELKYFFNSSINRFDGVAMASESVKDRISKIIANEDSRRPLSDQRIAEMLKRSNIDIARRTVTKYREALNVLSSTKRRQVG